MLIKVFGMRRSGNHAVINWLLGLLDQPLFFNDVRLYGNPLTAFGPVSVPEGVRVTVAVRDTGRVVTGVEVVPLGGQAANGHLVCSYEHVDMATLDMNRLDRSITEVLGPYPDVRSVVIVRNPLNVFASYVTMKGRKGRRPPPVREQIRSRVADLLEVRLDRRMGLSVRSMTRPEWDLVMRWKAYAALALAPDSPTRGTFIPVLFDQFVVDRAYRDALANRLGMENVDRHVDFVSNAGRGSSFDGLAKPNPADLLTRWRGTEVGERLQRYVANDLEFQDYCLRLFRPEHLDPKLFPSLRN